MRIPRKADLISLQEIYKSDDKIAEALGGIPEYLVAYWRRKKGVPPHSAPKFSEQQITELWERYGDDFRCGRELNISKAAFYSWRRKYALLERPVVLKLEQLELRLPGDGEPELPDLGPTGESPRTATAKILARAGAVSLGAEPDADWTLSIGAQDLAHLIACNPGPKSQTIRAGMEPSEVIPDADKRVPFACSLTRGDIEWQLIEALAILPGQFVSAPRGLAAGFGGIGALVLEPGMRVGSVDVIRVEVTRRLPAACEVEDIAFYCQLHGWFSGRRPRVLEFVGAPIERLTVDRKVKLCKLAVALGAHGAVCPFDDTIRRHFGRMLYGRYPQSHPDRTAAYQEEHFLEGHSLEPFAARTENDRWIVHPAKEASVGALIIGPHALPYEIEVCATLLKDSRARMPGTIMVCPATQQVYDLAYRRGWAQTIVRAGGSVLDLALGGQLGIDGLAQIAEKPGRGQIHFTHLSGKAYGVCSPGAIIGLLKPSA